MGLSRFSDSEGDDTFTDYRKRSDRAVALRSELLPTTFFLSPRRPPEFSTHNHARSVRQVVDRVNRKTLDLPLAERTDAAVGVAKNSDPSFAPVASIEPSGENATA